MLALIDGIMSGIVDNDLYLIDPMTGKPTMWGVWNPKEMNHNADRYSERGTNSVQILGWLAGVYSITGNTKYLDTFWDLVKNHKYIQNTLNVKIDSAIDENHCDTELVMLAYHALFYAYQRLPEGHERKEELLSMVSLIVPSLERTFLLAKGELHPIWMGIYAGVADQRHKLSPKDISDAMWSLRKWPMDNVEYPIFGDQRIDEDVSPFLTRGGGEFIMRHIRPPQERGIDWTDDPFAVDGNRPATTELEPTVFLWPYYMAKYYELLV